MPRSVKEIKKDLKEVRQKKLDASSKVDSNDDVEELKRINQLVNSLNQREADLQNELDEAQEERGSTAEEEGTADVNNSEEGAVEKRTSLETFNILGTYGLGGHGSQGETRSQDYTKLYEQRGEDLKNNRSAEFSPEELELRAVTIGSGDLVTETKYSQTLSESFERVSSIIDLVNSINLPGGEAYEKGFEVSHGEGEYTSEEEDYKEAEPVFDYVNIGKAKITAYAEMSDESKKLPNVDYQSMVRQSMSKSLRKKVAKQILVGPGGNNAITGIFNAPSKVIPDSGYDLEVPEITADTLDNIVLGYGGDEEVEGDGYLILNKKDLAAFNAVRDANGKKLYKIKLNGNTGTISSDESFEVPFVINSACPALSDSSTSAGTFCMAYGFPIAYELPMFSPVEVEESRDFKFKSGQVAYRGSVWVGGNVAMYKGFIRVKKG